MFRNQFSFFFLCTCLNSCWLFSHSDIFFFSNYILIITFFFFLNLIPLFSLLDHLRDIRTCVIFLKNRIFYYFPFNLLLCIYKDILRHFSCFPFYQEQKFVHCYHKLYISLKKLSKSQQEVWNITMFWFGTFQLHRNAMRIIMKVKQE